MVEQVAISWMNGWVQDGAALAIRANNLAFHYANSNYLLFLNPDCLVYPGTLGEIRGVIDARSDAGMTRCLTRNSYGMEQAGCCRSIGALMVAGVCATPRPVVRRGQRFLKFRSDGGAPPFRIDGGGGDFLGIHVGAMVGVVGSWRPERMLFPALPAL